MPAAAAVAAPERTVFYAPKEPEIGIKLPDRIDPIRFRAGVLETDDPEVIDALRRRVADGRFLEADMAVAIECDICKVKFRNQQAFAQHTQAHFDR